MVEGKFNALSAIRSQSITYYPNLRGSRCMGFSADIVYTRLVYFFSCQPNSCHE